MNAQKSPHFPGMTRVVERNIEALVARRQRDETAMGLQERLADAITRFTGSMTFVYLHLVGFGLWIAINLGWLPIHKFDPSFVMLAMFASVEAIFLSTFVLISQNRMQALADTRADLDLHISLLAEHELTRLIQLNLEMARRLGMSNLEDADLVEAAQDVLPERVLDQLEQSE